MALFYQRLVGDPRVLDWAAAVESEKRKSPVVEWRYGHCMLNFRKSWAARLVLGVDREEMAQKLMEEFDFSITSQEQRKALDNFGYFTDFSVELLKSVEGGHIKVVFRMDHAVEIQGPDGTSETISYGSVETFPPILENIRRKLQNDLERKTTMSITIKPVRFTENGFMTEPFALGGEGAEGLDPNVKYRSCLQNWVIDTGSEVSVYHQRAHSAPSGGSHHARYGIHVRSVSGHNAHDRLVGHKFVQQCPGALGPLDCIRPSGIPGRTYDSGRTQVR